MRYLIVGLGNPKGEHAETRHNVGEMFLRFLSGKQKTELVRSKNGLSEEGEVRLDGKKVSLLFPLVFMNNSGKAVSPKIKSGKDREGLVVVYDDLDLPLGKVKLSYGRSSGGHRGLESVIRAIKSKDFLRVRVGISPTTPSGKLKKPSGEKEVIKFILGQFKPAELIVLKKEFKKIADALEVFVEKGRDAATSFLNAS